MPLILDRGGATGWGQRQVRLPASLLESLDAILRPLITFIPFGLES